MAGLIKNFSSRVLSQSEVKAEIWNLVQPERGSLEKLKRLSIRSGVWFRVLNWKQRRLLDIVMKTVDRIRSPLFLRNKSANKWLDEAFLKFLVVMNLPENIK